METATQRYFIWTVGCQMNQADSARVAAALQEAGLHEASDEESADIVILNSCSVRRQAELRIEGKLGALQGLKRRRPAMKVALTGCMVTGQQAALKRQFPVIDYFFEPSDLDDFARQTLSRSGDGKKVSKAEVFGLVRPQFEKLDTNKDGYLDLEELKKVAEWLNQHHQPGTPSTSSSDPPRSGK